MSNTPRFLADFLYERHCKSLKLSLTCLLVSWLCLAGSTFAQVQDQPSPTTNNFETVEQADAAIRDVKEKRREIEIRNAQDLQGCASIFFTTRCVDLANERRRSELALLRPIEIDANTFKRQARVTARDKNLDEQRLKIEQETNSRPRELKTAKPQPVSAVPRATASSTSKQIKPPSIVDPSKLEQNRAAFDKKARDAAEHQKAVVERKADKERDRLAKKAVKEKEKESSEAITTVPLK
jgi:colicin import membrane protein